MHRVKLLQAVSACITFSSEFTTNTLLWAEIKNVKSQLEKKRLLEACKPRKFPTLACAAKRIAETAKKSATYQSADRIVGTF